MPEDYKQEVTKSGYRGGELEWAPAPTCCRCLHRRPSSPRTCLAVCCLLFTYNLLGGFLFLALEGPAPAEETAVAASKPELSRPHGELRSETVERLWSITEDLNILYKENWTKLAAKELLDFQRILVKMARVGPSSASQMSPGSGSEHRWTFASSFLYALTLITTIGPGEVGPRSAAGRLAAVAYAGAGVPLVMLYLSTLGGALARLTTRLYARLRPNPSPRASSPICKGKDTPQTPFQAALNLRGLRTPPATLCRGRARVPAALSLGFLVLYVALGMLVFHETEGWSFAEGCYFSFSTLATIGFGELRPGRGGAPDVAVAVCCAYILVGIVVVATCFDLVREDLSGVVRGAACGAASPS